jgi:hypothetical protein
MKSKEETGVTSNQCEWGECEIILNKKFYGASGNVCSNPDFLNFSQIKRDLFLCV